MKKISLLLLLAVFLLCGKANPASAADTPVKSEMRSAWVATVWRLDWPSVVVSSTGNTKNIEQQKKDMTTLLDSLQINNFNAINFQVRSRCDAFYKSSYEPWSSDLVATRGMDPGWDPLEWTIQECHKRGLECHAWVNPYRYESVSGQWNGTPKCYRESHPDWILDVNGAAILNPGKQEVIDQIVRVIREIVQNYDVDGILFDDYFYLSGTPTGSNGDGDLYAAYKNNGGTLSQADWRRDNVNRMIRSVYNMIQEEKPWVRFGVSPAGIACTSSTVARKYGISPCPTGSDWQYNDIYSDPIAWLADKSIDFISPQIYWTIGNSTDYDKAAKWWSEVADKFGRHFYSSHSISNLTSGSTATPLSIAEQNIATPMASGPNANNYNEYSNQVRLNRNYSLNNAPGSIFYSCKYIYKNSPKFGHHLLNTVFNTRAIVPALTFKGGYNPGQIKNLKLDNSTLSWQGYDNVRYTVYAVPNTVPTENFDKNAEYLLGVSYSTSYTIPKKQSVGYKYAVCVLDRYGNEYSPVFLGQSSVSLDKPVLVYPENGESLEAPFTFKWNAVENAAGYAFELSATSDFAATLATKIIYTPELNTSEIENLPLNKTLYWRVRAMGNNYMDGISETRNFKASQLLITSPENGATNVSLTPLIKWNPSRNVKIEISEKEDFSIINYTASGSRNSHTVPAGNLSGMKEYFVRLSYTKNDETCVTPTVSFTTELATPVVAEITSPAGSSKFDSTGKITVAKISGHTKIVVDVAEDNSFPSRKKFTRTLYPGNFSIDVSDVRISSKELVPGTEYYFRAKAYFTDAENKSFDTGYSTVVKATYMDNAGVDGIETDNGGIFVSGNILVTDRDTDVAIYDVAGSLTASFTAAPGENILPELPSGVYIIKTDAATIKYIRR